MNPVPPQRRTLAPVVRVVDLALDPWDLLERWPNSLPVAAAIAGDDTARWSIIGPIAHLSHDPSTILASTAPGSPPAPDAPPFESGWIGSLSYEWGWETEPGAAGHAFESPGKNARNPATPPRRSQWPTATFARLEAALIFDHLRRVWWESGHANLAAQINGITAQPCEAGVPRSQTGRHAYEAAAARVLEYIRAGDIYQANIAHALVATYMGRPLDWFITRGRAARPRYGAFIESPRAAVASLSPELFLEYLPAERTLITRPMKGTRPAEQGQEDLVLAEKDRAELAMIVDLLRNDLGRVSELGSVRVEVPREVERHGSQARGVLQATATVRSTLRAGLTRDDAVRGCFPGGSVTGAPKVRAMQIIEELEPSPRGPYCGACGVIADQGWMRLNVAIRTALFEAGSLSYSVGAGIVAESDPAQEWEETLVKARAAWPDLLND